MCRNCFDTDDEYNYWRFCELWNVLAFAMERRQ